MSEDKVISQKPKAQNSLAQKELDRAADQFDKFDAEVKSMTMDRMNTAPKEEEEPQTKISTKEAQKSQVYLKPHRTIAGRDKFNEKFRDAYNFDKEYVQFIAEHKEIIGETIDMWTKPYAGVPAEEWLIPTNKPIWAPRYVAEQIKRKFYHRLVMRDVPTETTGVGTMYGSLAVDTTVSRLDAHPVSQRKSVFMGANNF